MRLRYVIVFVTDLDRSLKIYRDLVGLPVREETRSSVEFEVGGSTFVIHIAHVEDPAHHHPPLLAGSCRLGFEVRDLDTVHARLLAAGVRCLKPPEAQFDLRVALYEDPDGLNFTLAEPMPG